MVVFLEACLGALCELLEVGVVDIAWGFAFELDDGILAEHAWEEGLEFFLCGVDALLEEGQCDAVGVGFLDEHFELSGEFFMVEGVQAREELFVEAFFASGREGVEDEAAADGGAVAFDALEAAQDEAILGEEDGGCFEVDACVCAGARVEVCAVVEEEAAVDLDGTGV